MRFSKSWCSWTTFDRLSRDSGYWTSGFPHDEDIQEDHIADGGPWGQPFNYSELAHIIVPKVFSSGFEEVRSQDIVILSDELKKVNIHHRIGQIALEIKLF